VKQSHKTSRQLTRRRFLGLALGTVAIPFAGLGTAHAKGREVLSNSRQQPVYAKAVLEGRLSARPVSPQPDAPAPALTGLQRLNLGGEREGLLYVPTGYDADQPAPLVLSLHGAGGNARQGLALLQGLADEMGFLLLAPSAHQQTWDVIRGGYGPDVLLIDKALEQTFSRYTIDPSHVAIGGFSDGASYALSLGIINGTLFSHVIAFSPGFMAPTGQEGTPRFFVSHGTEDQVLPIDRCSRRIVPQLQNAGYDVRYLEFAGGHTVPEDIAHDAVDWFRR
jgi:phospholipase/carboxylesterase